jgi:hypothetical protein
VSFSVPSRKRDAIIAPQQEKKHEDENGDKMNDSLKSLLSRHKQILHGKLDQEEEEAHEAEACSPSPLEKKREGEDEAKMLKRLQSHYKDILRHQAKQLEMEAKEAEGYNERISRILDVVHTPNHQTPTRVRTS